MVKLKKLRMDAERAIRGAWLTVHVDEDGKPTRFRVRRWSNALLAEFARKHHDKDWTSVQRGFAFLGGVLITEVEGLEDDDGNPIVWSEDYGIEFFQHCRAVDVDDDDDEQEQFHTLEYIADQVMQFARSDDPYIGELSGN